MTQFRALAVTLALALTPLAAPAVQPDEVLADPLLEERARDISQNLRCLVCRNENIDESNATLAKDLRLLVRERLVEGDTNEEVVDYVVDRFGEYVLLKPTLTGANKLLWIAGPLMLLAALGVGFNFLRRRQAQTDVADLTDEESARLKALLDE